MDSASSRAAVYAAHCKLGGIDVLINNAGISQIVVRDDKENFRIIEVASWIDDDDSLSGVFGY